MIKNFLLFSLLVIPFSISYGQENIDEIFIEADAAYFDYENFEKALELYTEIKNEINEEHEYFGYIVDKIARTLFNLQLQSNAENSIKYSLEFIDIVEKHPSFMDELVLEKKYFIYKNLVVAYYEKEKLNEAKKYQELLYQAYENNELPNAIDKYYYFEFFKFEDKNVWGYEWYNEIPEDRFGSSFTKIVYYVYDTNEDGSDKNQLFRLHVLMFHKIDDSIEFDYVLTKISETETEIEDGTYYAYTYSDPVDFKALRKDVRELLINNAEPDTKTYFKK